MVLRDQPRPEGYWPGTPSQWREATIDDCAWYATEAAFEAASETHRSVHPVKGLRAFSSDTEGGTPISVAIRDTQRLWPASERVVSEYGAYERAYLVRLLKEGAMLVVGGYYANLPTHYRRWTNNDNFAHALACKFYRRLDGVEYTFLYDPLGGGPTRQPYDGEWITLDALLNWFTWGTGTKKYAGIVQNRGDDPVQRLYVSPTRPADREVRVARGVTVRKAPRTTSAEVRRVWSEERWFPLVATASNGWRLIAWDLDVDNTNIGYIHTGDIIETRQAPPPTNVVDKDAYELAIKTLTAQNQSLTEMQAEAERDILAQEEEITVLKLRIKRFRAVLQMLADELKKFPTLK